MPTQTSPTLEDLLRLLNAATDRNAIHWETTAQEDAFRTEFGLGMVRIEKVVDSGGYVLYLLNNDGTILEEYRPSGEQALIGTEALYQKARRQALNLEGKLKNVFDHLKRLAGES